MRLDFAVVGPQRSGTTWTYEYLRGHPEVFVSPLVKESRFFDLAYDRGMDWYAGLFEGASASQRVGEVAPTYFHDGVARERLCGAFPRCVVVVMLREPIERLTSLYHHLRRTGRIPEGMALESALDREPLLVETSRYATHVAAWREAFEVVRLLSFDRLQDDEAAFAGDICRALGVRYVAPADDLRRGEAVDPRSYRVSRMVSATSRTLRRLGAHRLVNLGKRLGLREMLVGRRPMGTGLDPDVAATIWQRIGGETLRLEPEAGLDLGRWRSRWREMGIEA